jgi:hypothetical protein
MPESSQSEEVFKAFAPALSPSRPSMRILALGGREGAEAAKRAKAGTVS